MPTLTTDSRLEKIYRQISKLAEGKFDYREQTSQDDDHLDAVITGLNMLADELNHQREANHQLLNEQEKVKRSLQKNEELMKMVFDANSDSMSVIDLQTRTITSYNKAFKDGLVAMLNRSVDDELQEITIDFFWMNMLGLSPVEIQRNNEIIERVKSNLALEQYEEERSFGDIRTVLDHTVYPIVKNGECVNILWQCKDITASREAERQISKSQENLVQAQRIARIGTWTWSPATGDLYWSSQLHRNFGVTEETIPDYDLFMSLVHPEDRDALTKLIYRCIETKESYEIMHRVITPMGQMRYFQCHGEAICDSNGELTGLLGTSQDVTERHLSQRRLSEQNRQLEGMNAKLQDVNKQLEEIAHVASHDLKAPLVNLDALMSMLEETQPLDEKGQEIVGKSHQSLSKMRHTLETINLVIDSRYKLNLPPEDIAFEACLEEVLIQIDDQVQGSNAQIDADFSGCPRVNYPEFHLNSIFQNLITNAIKYAGEGVSPKITIKSSVVDDSPFLTISDNGMGINMELYKEKLFKLFKRFHPKIEGRGIGLHIIHTMVKNHGGNIEVESELGKGTTFHIQLLP